MSDFSLSAPAIVLDDTIRGFPSGHGPLPLAEIGKQGWKPYDGIMSLPLISLDHAAFAGNIDAMMGYVRSHHIDIAPHSKTPMAPALARQLLAAGAWGTTVADIRQASVMLRSGFKRLIIANEIGGTAAAKRLAALLAGYADAEIHVFIDSLPLAAALHAAWQDRSDLPQLGLLPELGLARAGSRTIREANEIVDYVLARETSRFRLSGIAAYEGSASTPDPIETIRRISTLMTSTVDLYRSVREKIGTDRPLVVTAGGSAYFDLVTKALCPVLKDDANAHLVLRSGAIFFHDHGVYEAGLAALDRRNGFEIDGQLESAAKAFKPALSVWAEILSRPEPELAICGMGHRDVAMDQGLPRPLEVYRDGRKHAALSGAIVTKLNDQHAFVDLGGKQDIQIGDIVRFGISHPCTCLDRHGVLYGLDEEHRVTAAYPTHFG